LKRFAGRGFADVRKKHVVSKYHRVVAKEKKNLTAWNAKLKRIYAETENTEDPLERFGSKRKRKRKNDVFDSCEQGTCEKETDTAVEPTDEVVSRSSAGNTSSEKPSTADDTFR